jgi:hypothetical protein
MVGGVIMVRHINRFTMSGHRKLIICYHRDLPAIAYNGCMGEWVPMSIGNLIYDDINFVIAPATRLTVVSSFHLVGLAVTLCISEIPWSSFFSIRGMWGIVATWFII